MDWTSPSFSLDDREGEFAVSFSYTNGLSVDMTILLQVSLDNEEFVDVGDTEQQITDESGLHIWDLAGSGALFARVKVKVSAGSIDVNNIYYSAKQRH